MITGCCVFVVVEGRRGRRSGGRVVVGTFVTGGLVVVAPVEEGGRLLFGLLGLVELVPGGREFGGRVGLVGWVVDGLFVDGRCGRGRWGRLGKKPGMLILTCGRGRRGRSGGGS